MKLRRKNPNLSNRERKAAKMLGRGQIVADVARKLNVVVSTVCEWEQKPKFQELMAKEAKKSESIFDEAQDDIDYATVESAKVKGPQGLGDRRLFYQKQGQLIERQKIEMEPLVIIRADKTGEREQEEKKDKHLQHPFQGIDAGDGKGEPLTEEEK